MEDVVVLKTQSKGRVHQAFATSRIEAEQIMQFMAKTGFIDLVVFERTKSIYVIEGTKVEEYHRQHKFLKS